MSERICRACKGPLHICDDHEYLGSDPCPYCEAIWPSEKQTVYTVSSELLDEVIDEISCFAIDLSDRKEFDYAKNLLSLVTKLREVRGKHD